MFQVLAVDSPLTNCSDAEYQQMNVYVSRSSADSIDNCRYCQLSALSTVGIVNCRHCQLSALSTVGIVNCRHCITVGIVLLSALSTVGIVNRRHCQLSSLSTVGIVNGWLLSLHQHRCHYVENRLSDGISI